MRQTPGVTYEKLSKLALIHIKQSSLWVFLCTLPCRVRKPRLGC